MVSLARRLTVMFALILSMGAMIPQTAEACGGRGLFGLGHPVARGVVGFVRRGPIRHAGFRLLRGTARVVAHPFVYRVREGALFPRARKAFQGCRG